jgi:DNA-binding CsgD family transcriptional regulator
MDASHAEPPRNRRPLLFAAGSAGGRLLTRRERQIARLAVEGKTNQEIGTQLYLSRRTVEWHLNRIFSKLAIDSRRELAGLLEVRASRP